MTRSLSAAFLLLFAWPALGNTEQAVPFELEVPFECGTRAYVSQGHGGFSHVGIDRWSWDFRMPEGTPVVAARSGVVRLARGDSTVGGCDRKLGRNANYVIISHEQGLETQYLHLSKVFVEPGQKVAAGEAIGEVGNTGFSCGAHLHFQLQEARPGWANPSVPARFRTWGDPDVRQTIVSQNCAPPPVRKVASGAKSLPAARARGGSGDGVALLPGSGLD